MKLQYLLIIFSLGYLCFHYFHLYNYEIILIGKILYVNSMIKNDRLTNQLIHSFIICFSSDILFRALIYEFQDRDLPKLVNSILAQIVITIGQWKFNFKFESDICYNLSQAKLLTWAFKNKYLQAATDEYTFARLFCYLVAASIYQNLLLGSVKNIITTIISLLGNYLYQPFFFLYQPQFPGLTAYRSKHYLSQFIFYIMKLF